MVGAVLNAAPPAAATRSTSTDTGREDDGSMVGRKPLAKIEGRPRLPMSVVTVAQVPESTSMEMRGGGSLLVQRGTATQWNVIGAVDLCVRRRGLGVHLRYRDVVKVLARAGEGLLTAVVEERKLPVHKPVA